MFKISIFRRKDTTTCALQGFQFLLKRSLSVTTRVLDEAEASGGETTSKPKETIGFIGLGNMGTHMGQNLIKGGYNLVVYDMYPEAMDPFTALGATAVTTPRLVAQQVNKIITMLPSSPDVKEVYCGHNGILGGLQEGSCRFIQLSC